MSRNMRVSTFGSFYNKTRSSGLYDALHGMVTAIGQAGQTFASIDIEGVLKITKLTVSLTKISQ